jgi:leukotriene-A4 hydrolase
MRSLLPALVFAVSAAHAAPDPHSYANFDAVQVEHAHLDLTVSFERSELAGFVELQLLRKNAQADTLILDSRDLVIESVLAVDAQGQFRPTRFALAVADPIFGQALSIQLPAQSTRVRVYYHSLPQASGLQWLPPELTAGKQHPFMFSQSQAIHARSWVPIQDSPAVRFSYSARISTPPGLLARMSANNDPLDAADGDYRFLMQQPIPSYLLALAVGDLKFAPLGERSGVYAEPSMLQAAAQEFTDTEHMIEIAESLYGPYRWERYDLLVLPPSFPFGGMENPRLTFLTPTVIAGDRSLVSLIAHELAHSWSGNLVTNRTWDHFWLNEGFTTYVENRIVEATFGSERADMERQLAERDLDEELAELAPADQSLRLDLRGRDPDDGLTEVAYTKGMTFLRFLEQRFGREVFDPFVRAWFDRHAFGSADTNDFLAFLKNELLDHHPGLVTGAEIAQFIEGPGYPGIAPRTRAARFDVIDQIRTDWLAGSVDLSTLDSKAWSTQEWIRLIEGLPGDLDRSRLEALDHQFQLSRAGNSEIAFAWYLQAIEHDYRPAFAPMQDFLQRIGRRKFVLPLFTALMRNPAQQDFARAAYAKARAGYHPITRDSVDAAMASD